jgi:DNA-binding SARP family transcriptional activator
LVAKPKLARFRFSNHFASFIIFLLCQQGFWIKIVKAGEVQQTPLAEDRRHLDVSHASQLDVVLSQEQAAAEKSSNLLLASILAIARHLNQTCGQYEAEAQAHQDAYADVMRRLAMLQQQRQFFLTLAQEYRDSGTLERIGKMDSSVAGDLGLLLQKQKSLPEKNLWRRLQDLVRLPPVPVPPPPGLPAEEKVGGEKRPFLTIYTLGQFQVYLDDNLIKNWPGAKTLTIFKFLAARRGTPVLKDILMDTFWPDTNLDATRRNLHQAIYTLRQTLRQDSTSFQHILFENDSYRFNPELNLWLDFAEFEKHVRAGQYKEALGKAEEAANEYSRAESLYQGDFLAENPYDDWPLPQREQLRNAYIDIATRLSNYYIQRKQFGSATKLNQKILQQDPYHEEAHCQLMRCYEAQGLRHLAIRQYHILVAALEEELGLSPSPKTNALFQPLSAK